MGQKTHPIGFRLGTHPRFTWRSRWFAKKGYADLLHEDAKIRRYIKEALYHAGWDFYRNEWWHYQLFDARRYPLRQTCRGLWCNRTHGRHANLFSRYDGRGLPSLHGNCGVRDDPDPTLQYSGAEQIRLYAGTPGADGVHFAHHLDQGGVRRRQSCARHQSALWKQIRFGNVAIFQNYGRRI